MSQAQKKIKPPSKLKYTIAFLILAALYVVSWRGVKGDIGELIDGLPNIGDMMAQLWPPDFNYFIEILDPMLETIQMAILGTTFGALLSIPMILLASSNIFGRKVVLITRAILNVTRTIPELLFAGIFVAIVGLGPFAGIMALTLFSFGIITKMTYESVETIDPGPLEAMTAVGANKLQYIGFAVVPQALPAFVAYVFYTFEVCVRASAILGLVGAGGIGLVLNTALAMYQYTHVASIILFTLIIVILIDTISTRIREKLI
ncbi:phosphonate ABC transporter, permease protein PhnE [Tumebacillus lipolyticus]|uniref:Phosphonate ABC transporter, permease protein PhnE n=1 Tax=Tumebacillus lipolyticus TaxID=1280370 RepID=A0ABW5A148_9BACL